MCEPFLKVRFGDQNIKVDLIEESHNFFIEDNYWPMIQRSITNWLRESDDDEEPEFIFNGFCSARVFFDLESKRWQVDPSN